jgi:hypothetical protein
LLFIVYYFMQGRVRYGAARQSVDIWANWRFDSGAAYSESRFSRRQLYHEMITVGEVWLFAAPRNVRIERMPFLQNSSAPLNILALPRMD